MEEAKVEAALDICNILPAHLFEETIKILSKIDQDLTNKILVNKEGPIKIKFDSEEKKYFLGNMFNKEKDSYRSPYTNMYYPDHLPHSYIPSEPLRSLEILYNEIFDRYRKAYYINGLSSVYLWPNPVEDGFVACFLIKKNEIYDKNTYLDWEGTHLIQVNLTHLVVHYQISSTLNISISRKNEIILSASINKALENPKKISDINLIKDKYFHMENMGKMIEGIENSLRKSIEYIYLPKMNGILNSLRYNDYMDITQNGHNGTQMQHISNDLTFQKGHVQDELREKLKSKNLSIGKEYLLNT
ncbi:F-actin-capping protein subunit beta, putative [Plasmodium ovale]|uniref:F-actin-capping protein subunit beta n=2 Tax=Plasmodium ovale TaxID=36330 RepID=A0A1A8WI95_PLAOA|nr:F-actin-capping protein subunit beta, putative (CPbeta) [Plasmodium ovale curtisi]SBS92664.1 F-actin-capping protein subunit beta, putative (CPbeta) [Plasmodium ovale curtisi]SCQ16489.1 F-actin-capping protein subunit beta, putative [Plasmodium ovale]